MQIPESAREVLESDALGHVVTLNPDGSPNVTIAWIGLEGDEVVFATVPDQRKLHNLRRDPRIAISLETQRTNEWGLREYLVVEGRARVTEGGAAAKLQELAQTYIGPGAQFPVMPDAPPGFITRVTVDRLWGVGPWAPPPPQG